MSGNKQCFFLPTRYSHCYTSFWCFLGKKRVHTHTHTQSPGSSVFVNGPCPLCPHRKSNWIADRMKKLIKPKGGREGRALFTAAGSVENLADSTEFTSDTHTANPGKNAHTHQPTGFHKDMLTFSNHQAGLQACIQIISWHVWPALIPLSSPPDLYLVFSANHMLKGKDLILFLCTFWLNLLA